MMTFFYWALGCILAAGLLPFILRRSFRLMKIISIGCFAVGGILGLIFAVDLLLSGSTAPAAAFPFPGGLILAFKIDSLSAFFLLPIFLITPVAILYSYHYLEKPNHALRVAANYFFFSILTIAMALVACADNILTFAMAWEAMSLSSYFLVIYDYEKKNVCQAGYLYFVFAQAGAMALFAAFALAYSYTGSLNFEAFTGIPMAAKALIFTLAFIGLGSKAGIFPLHIWLPHAHPAAPSHISAVMSGVMIKMGIYGIIRMYALLQPAGAYCAILVITTGAVTGVLAVVYALSQHDIKRLLAYSSAENIGIILLGIGIGMLGIATGNPTMALLGFCGGLLHVINHAIFKSLLFMGAGAVLHRTGTLIIERLGGLLKKMPISGVTFLIGSLAICGLPPFNGFISEFLIYTGALFGARTSQPLFLFIALAILSLAVIGGLAIACFTKVVGVAFQGEPRSQAAAEAQPAGPAIRAAMLLLAAACIGIGLMPQLIIPLARRAAELVVPVTTASRLVDTTIMARNLSLSAAGFIALVLLIISVRRLFRRGTPAQSTTWGCGFTQPSSRMQYTGSSFTASFVDFYRPFVQLRENFTGIHGLFPNQSNYNSEAADICEIGLHRGLMRPVLKMTAKLRWLQHGHIQLYIGYIFFAMLGLLFWLVL
jgi:hydrogenase-4 component B